MPGPRWRRGAGTTAALLAVVLLVWSRAGPMAQGLWHDEVVTAVRFVADGPASVFRSDYLPNNHMLFSMLTWVATSLLGSAEATYRLASVIPGIAAVLVMSWFLRRRFGGAEALVFLVAASLAPLHLDLVSQARGYGLAFLAAAGLVVAADAAATRGRGHDWVLVGVWGLVGIATLPVFVLPFLGTAAALWLSGGDRRAVTITVVAAGVASLAWYAPVVGALLASTGQEFGHVLPWWGAANRWAVDLLFDLFRLVPRAFASEQDAVLPGAAGLPLVALAYALVAPGAWRLHRAGERALLGVLAAPVVITYFGLTLMRVHVAPRFTSYLLVHLLALVAVGVPAIARAVAPQRPAAASLAVVAVVAVALGTIGSVRHATWVLHAPIEAVADAGKVVNGSGITPVLTNSTRPEGLRWYVHARVHRSAGADLHRALCSRAGPYVFVHEPFRAPPVEGLGCLDARGALRVRLSQRLRGGHIDVWLVPAARGTGARRSTAAGPPV